jgi:TatD DNase family protein
VAEAAMQMGFYISFSGIVTFKSAQALREVAAVIPDERLLVETDSPYLAPVPHRGKSNEPAWVADVAACLATLRGQPVEHLHATTSKNFMRLFNIL